MRRYFSLRAERERLERKAARQPIVPGSAGQDTLSPLYGRLDEVTREIEKYRQELGILPLARMRLGVATGHARSALEDMREQLRRRQEAEAGIEEVPDDVVADWFRTETGQWAPRPPAQRQPEVIDLATLED